MIDLLLAIAHHVLVFGLVIMLAVQIALVREGMAPADVARIARLDIGYGTTAALLLIVGIFRVIFGAKGSAYYIENAWYWAKMTGFSFMFVFSLVPTLQFRTWRNAQKIEPDYTPKAAEIRQIRAFFRLELALLMAVVALAATMARYTGL